MAAPRNLDLCLQRLAALHVSVDQRLALVAIAHNGLISFALTLRPPHLLVSAIGCPRVFEETITDLQQAANPADRAKELRLFAKCAVPTSKGAAR
jgi:hypothetical protein